MAIEKRLKAVSPKAFTANGTADGKVTILYTGGFKVKQVVVLKSNTSSISLEIKRIESSSVLYVGPVKSNINDRSDISAFTVADQSTIEAQEQPRPSIPEQEIERLTYEEEPTVARRTVLVDELGNKYSDSNPLPVSATVQTETYDDVQMDYDPITQDMIEARFYKSGNLSYTLTFEYDENENLIGVYRE